MSLKDLFFRWYFYVTVILVVVVVTVFYVFEEKTESMILQNIEERQKYADDALRNTREGKYPVRRSPLSQELKTKYFSGIIVSSSGNTMIVRDIGYNGKEEHLVTVTIASTTKFLARVRKSAEETQKEIQNMKVGTPVENQPKPYTEKELNSSMVDVNSLVVVKSTEEKVIFSTSTSVIAESVSLLPRQ